MLPNIEKYKKLYLHNVFRRNNRVEVKPSEIRTWDMKKKLLLNLLTFFFKYCENIVNPT